VFVLFLVYRGSVSFTLTARAEGELLENNQVMLMMRLSLCMIWISVMQHIVLSCPLSKFMDFKRTLLQEPESTDEGDSLELEDSNEVPILRRGASSMKLLSDWYSRIMVRPSNEEMEANEAEMVKLVDSSQ